MNNTYQFTAILKENNTKGSILRFIAIACVFITLIVSIVLIVRRPPNIGTWPITIIIFSIVIVLSYLFVKLSNPSIKAEEWVISFNDDSIGMSSNRRIEKVYPYSRLTLVELFKDTAPLGETLSIQFSFTELNDSDELIFTDTLHFEVTVFKFSSVPIKNNFDIFSQFLADIHQQILQYDFKLIDASSQQLVRLGKVGYRQPSRMAYFRKDTTILFSRTT